MEYEKQSQLIISRREMMKGHSFREEHFESGQELHLPQPPYEKSTGGELIFLPKDFKSLSMEQNLLTVLEGRKSRRQYTKESLSLTELSFLLWYTQGVKAVIGKRNFATMRTVPSAGARHPFELYAAVNRVEGLKPGKYHYLAVEHKLEYMGASETLAEDVSAACCHQGFVGTAAAVFFLSVIPYRTEYRYTAQAYKYCLIDAGHVMENLYLCCEAIGCGTCAIGAYDQEKCDSLWGLSSEPDAGKENEFIVYAAPVGKTSSEGTN